MRKIKILQVDLLNFKGFAELHVSFEDKDAVVLGGLNGYGKTTLFDALELLFTGTIKRMEEYSEFHDKRNAMRQENLPLVYSRVFSKEVVVQAILQVEEQKLWVFRKADVDDMRNPVDFRSFSDLMIHTADNEDRVLTDEELHQYGFDDLTYSYSFLNYLSQEEATAFLKRKEADRARDISELFNLSAFDERLDKIKSIISFLKAKSEDAKSKKGNAQEKVLSLKNVAGGKSDVPYCQICKESQYWDVENPKLSHEQFHALLAEDGLMDKLVFFVEHQDAFKQYQRNRYIDGIVNSKERLESIAFEIKYGHLREVLEMFGSFKRNVLLPFAALSLENMDKFSLRIPEPLMSCIEVSDIGEFESLRNDLLQAYQTSTAFQQRISHMLGHRQALAADVKERLDDLYSADCPLCGSRFDNKEKLTESIDEYGEVLDKYFSELGANMQKQLSTLRRYVQEHFVNPIDHYFTEREVVPDIYDKYSNLDLSFARKRIPEIQRAFDIQVDGSLPLEDIASALHMRLSEKKSKLPEELDFDALDNAYQLGGRYISKNHLTAKSIADKRSYLQMVWCQMASQELQKWQNDYDIYAQREKAITQLKKDMDNLKKNIEKQRQKYLSGLLSDIKILFYIYSGRIMQTCHFGRGLFIKPDEKCKSIIFTSDSNQGNDVDALYNMSSGQLVTLVVALLLSLNKLYSHTSLLAIDDPIQTIDDINLWGLIETLRHDFDDHFMILSTHERDYRDLLEYKFKKWHINTKVVDMAAVDSKR